MRGFWDQLNKPIMVLAPMADVTDAAFRFIIAKYGKPPVMYTEFVSTDGLCSVGRDRLMIDFKYSENEHPIVAQIFGATPENFYKSAQLAKELGFDGVDINMGCPVKKVLNQQSCSALIKTPTLAQEIIDATKEGAGDLPVSVKTRIGFYKEEIDTWLPKILEKNPAALIVHLRTVKEMSKAPAHWELMPQIVEMVKSIPEEQRPYLLGNGDIMNLEEAEQKVKETGCDGVMLGRAIFGNPWLFANWRKTNRNAEFNSASQVEIPNQVRDCDDQACPDGSQDSGLHVSIEEKMRVMIEHTYLFEKMFFGIKSFDVMKKHYKAYVNGFNGAKELRMELFESAKTAADVERIILKYFSGLKIQK